MEAQDKKESIIIDKIRNAGEDLGVTTGEVGEEMRRLTSENDSEGMKRLFNTYKEWEIRGRKKGVSSEQAEKQALRNFNLEAKKQGGETPKFYQESVGYTPPPETSS